MNKQLKSNLALLTAAIIWGFAFATQCMVNTDILGVMSFNGIRYVLGGLCLMPVALIFEKGQKDSDRLKKTIFYGIITGVVLFIASTLQMYGIAMVKSAGKSGFLTGLYIVIVPFYGAALYKRRVSFKEWMAAIIATVGLYFLSVTDGFGSITSGDIILIIGAFFWAMHIIVVDRYVEKVNPIKYSCVQFIVCGVLCLISALFYEKITVYGVTTHLIPILYTGLVSTGVGYTCQILGQKDANPNSACIIMSLEGVFSAIGGAIVFNEVMSIRGYFGCLLMLLGAILSQINLKK